jgi:hypothetical protein
MRFFLLAGTAILASMSIVGAAHAVPISTTFNFVPTGILTADGANIADPATTTITAGVPDIATTVFVDNTGLTSGTTIGLTDPTPVTVGATFTKSFTTVLGDFVASLTVLTSVPVTTATGYSLGITASGTITETTVLSGSLLDAAPDFYSAAYTQNIGPGGVINASFNDSTIAPVIPPVPEPVTISILGAGLVGLGAARLRRR